MRLKEIMHKDKNIIICGRDGCILKLRKESLPVILIGRDKGTDKFITKYATDILHLDFDDILINGKLTATLERLKELEDKSRIILPKKEHIELVLEWTANKNRFIVCCHAGISRSAALAYIIMCNYVSPIEAVKLWDKERHYPNDLIIRLGSQVLNNHEIWTVYQDWKNNE